MTSPPSPRSHRRWLEALIPIRPPSVVARRQTAQEMALPRGIWRDYLMAASRRSSAARSPSQFLDKLDPDRTQSGRAADATATATWLERLLAEVRLKRTAGEAPPPPIETVFMALEGMLEDIQNLEENRSAWKDLCDTAVLTLGTLQTAFATHLDPAQMDKLQVKCVEYAQLLSSIQAAIQELSRGYKSTELRRQLILLSSITVAGIAPHLKALTDFENEILVFFEECKPSHVPMSLSTSPQASGSRVSDTSLRSDAGAKFDKATDRNSIEDPLQTSSSFSGPVLSFGSVSGGIGGAGGSGILAAGQGGIGQGPSFNIQTNYTVFGDNVFIAQDKPSVYHGCPQSSDFFQGRQDILQQLIIHFGTTSKQEHKVVLLYGLGGVGKTQIALKFISDSHSRFTDQFKIDASSAETIQTGYEEIARIKKLENSMKAVHAWLRANHDEWLVFFDNADAVNLNLGPYLPKFGHGNILITSRNPNVGIHTGPAKRSIMVPDLDIHDAVVLFMNISGVSNKSEMHVLEIIQELHCFPLAIVQAAGFVSQDFSLQQDLLQYLSIYKRNKIRLWQEHCNQTASEYELSVYATWQLSFEQLSPVAREFLCLCSCIHFTGITENIFCKAAAYQPDNRPWAPTIDDLKPSWEFLSHFWDDERNWDTLAFRKMISSVCAYSLMTWQGTGPGNGYSMHPLVHEWTRVTMADSDRAVKRQLMVNLLGMCAAVSSATEERVPLVQHLVSIAPLPNVFNTEFVRVYRAGSLFLQAAALAKLEFNICTELLGSDHLVTIRSMARLGRTHYDLGRYQEAYAMDQNVLKKSLEILGEDHLDTVGAMVNLALSVSALGRYTEAHELEKQVLEKRTRILGPEHPETVQAMAGLATTYHQIGKHRRAQDLQEIVLETYIKSLGLQHERTIRAKSNLAAIYYQLQRYRDAYELQKQVLEERSRSLGADHLETLRTMASLAATCNKIAEDLDAQALQERVLRRYIELLGQDHPHTIDIVVKLSSTYHQLKQYAEAQALEKQILEHRIQTLGPDHTDTLRSMRNLAVTYSLLGRYEDAHPLEKQVLENYTEHLGTHDPRTIRAMSYLASTAHKLGKYTEAQSLRKQVLEHLDEEHPDTIQAMLDLASTSHELHQYQQAQKLRERVLERCIHLFGPENTKTIRLMANLATTYYGLEEYRKALNLNVQVLEKRLRLLGSDHAYTKKAVIAFAFTCTALSTAARQHIPRTVDRLP